MRFPIIGATDFENAGSIPARWPRLGRARIQVPPSLATLCPSVRAAWQSGKTGTYPLRNILCASAIPCPVRSAYSSPNDPLYFRIRRFSRRAGSDLPQGSEPPARASATRRSFTSEFADLVSRPFAGRIGDRQDASSLADVAASPSVALAFEIVARPFASLADTFPVAGEANIAA